MYSCFIMTFFFAHVDQLLCQAANFLFSFIQSHSDKEKGAANSKLHMKCELLLHLNYRCKVEYPTTCTCNFNWWQLPFFVQDFYIVLIRS